MLAEQTLLNAGVITADLTADDAAVAGYVFNALLIARAPLQLFQAVQGSLLPHLAGLEATEGRAEFEPRDPHHAAGHRGLRGRRRARPADPRPVGDEHPLRRGHDLRAPRPRRGRHRDGRPPRRRDAQPGRPRPRPRRRRGHRLADQRRRLRRPGCCRASSTTTSPAPRSGYLGAASLLLALLAVVYRGVRHPRRPPKRPSRAGAQLSPWPETLTMPGMTQPAMSRAPRL